MRHDVCDEMWFYAIEGSDVGVWDWNAVTGEVYFSPRWKSMLGYDEADIASHVDEWSSRIHPDDKEMVTLQLERYISGEADQYRSEHRLRCKDGSWKWILDRGKIVSRTEGGTPLRIVGTHTDISSLRDAEQARYQEARHVRIVSDVIRLANTCHDMHRFGAAVFDILFRNFCFEAGGIYLVNDDDATADLLLARNLPEDFLARVGHIDIADPAYRPVFVDRQIIVRELPPERAASSKLRIVTSIPIILRDKVIGALNAGTSLDIAPSQRDRTILLALGAELGNAFAALRSETALAAAYRNLETLFNTIDDFVFIVAPDTSLIEVNDTVIRRLGYTHEELTGMPVRLLHVPERRDEASSIIAAMLEGTRTHCPVPLIAKSGEIIEVETKVRHGIWNGRAVIYGVSRDITERNRMEQTVNRGRAKLAAMIDNLPFLAWQKDRDGHFEAVNELFAASCGHSIEDIIGRTDFDVWPHELAQKYVDDDQNVIRSGGRKFVEEKIQDKGRIRWFETYKTPIFDAAGTVIGTVGIARDISERKEFEEELNRAKDAAESANRAKSTFLANMSHELRTPMTAINGISQVLVSRDGDNLTERQREGLSLIHESGERLLGLINDLLDLSKVEAGRMTLQTETIRIDEFIASLRTFASTVTDADAVRVITEVAGDIPQCVVSDRNKLSQILINLIGNAAKFTEQGEIRVTVGMHESGLSFTVADTGIGIAPEHLDHIFEPFTQVDCSLSRRFKGTGLGLALTRKYAEFLGGSISITSAPGKGTAITVTIPLNACTEEQRPLQTVRSAAMHQGTGHISLIIAEDDPILRETFRFLLEGYYQLRFAASGAEALAELEKAPPDAVLTDIMMPEMDGTELLSRIRERYGSLPVIAVTARALHEEIDELRQKGFDGVITKPVRVDELNAEIGRLTGHNKPHHDRLITR